jgi:signal transduction histidine kinase/ligand-binding sensor domain-containing protein
MMEALAARWRPRAAFLLLVLAHLLLAGLAWAEVRPLERMEHRRWIAADGGPSQVGAIAQTRDGYLWLGTNDSLYRFDGFRFARYEAEGKNTLNIVSALLAVGDDLWVGLRFGGVRVIRADGMRHYLSGPSLPEGTIYSLARDRGSAIWAAADDGLARFDGARWELVGGSWNFPGRKARAVFVDRDGILWAANENRLFYLPEGSRSFVDTGLTVDWVSQITQAPDGAIWLTERYSGKLHRVVLAEGKVAAASAATNTPSIGLLFDRHGSLWISTTGNGVQYVANPASLAAVAAREPFTASNGLSSDFIWKMLEDDEGNLWVGTNAGLDRFRPRTLMPAGFPAGTLNFALAAGKDGSLWAGPSNRPAMRLADGQLSMLEMPAPVTCAMHDAEGSIWMGGPSGIWRSQGKGLVHVAALPPGALAESAVRAMVRDRAGDLWVSINRLGLFRLHAGAWTALAAPSAALNQRMPVSASADPQGRLWFGYRDNLLVTRDAAGEQRWGKADGLNVGHVTALAHHGQRTWVGGQHGIGFIDGVRFHPLRLPENGLFDNIYAIIPVPVRDGQGEDLWIHSKSGIFQLMAAELKRAFADAGHRIRYRSYDLMGGLANDPYQVLPLPTAIRTSDGRLWFSTSSGVAWIDPNRPPSEQAGPTVVIDAVSVDGARLPNTSSATLGAGTQRIVIDYTALSLSAPERLNFRYRLDGYDTNWHDAGRQREAVYTGLGAGDYTFRVLAHNKDGLPSTQEALFSFSIPRAFYLRPPFLVLAGGLGLALLSLLYRINMRRAARHLRQRLEERHSERERIARELHDTLLQGITGLILRFQAVADSMPKEHPARRDLEQTLDRADQVLVEGRDRVRNLRSALDPSTLQDALRSTGAELEHAGGSAFALTVLGVPQPLLPEVRDEAYRIGHEAIVNAFAHAGARHVTVGIDYATHLFQMKISDDGRGICPDYLGADGRPDHWGLRGMHERARRIDATLRVRSAVGQGSQVLMSLAAGRAYLRPPRRARGWRLFSKNKKEPIRDRENEID